MTSPANHVRDTIIATLQADATLTALVPAARIYPNKAPNGPTKPFIRLGPVDGARVAAGCWDGEDVDGAVHLYVAATDAIPDPESWAHDAAWQVAQLIDALADGFHDRTLVLPSPDEADEYHAIVYYRFTALEEA